MKQAQLKHPTVIIREPLMECARLIPTDWLLLPPVPFVHINSMTGPFTTVITIAPATVAAVPITLACDRMLFMFSFSSLTFKKNHQHFLSDVLYFVN